MFYERRVSSDIFFLDNIKKILSWSAHQHCYRPKNVEFHRFRWVNHSINLTCIMAIDFVINYYYEINDHGLSR